MLLRFSEDKHMKKNEGKQNQNFSLIGEACIQIIKTEIKKKNISKTLIKINNFLNEFKTANFEIQTSEMKFSTLSTSSKLSDKTVRVNILNSSLLQTAEHDYLNLGVQFIEFNPHIAINRHLFSGIRLRKLETRT
jgi:hypothetical protein